MILNMTNFFFIILLITPWLFQKTDRVPEKHSLPDINIQFETGCEYRLKYSIAILNKNNKLIAKKIKPNYYYGNFTDSIWTIELDSNKINLIKKFINKAKEFNGECPIITSSIDYYEITIHKDTVYKIGGNCNWEGLDFFSIEKKLFQNHFELLNKKRVSLKDSLNKILSGQWIVTGLNKELGKRDTIILWRTDELDENENGAVFWKFFDGNKFNCNDSLVFNLAYSKNYSFVVDYGYVGLAIQAGTKIEQNGKETYTKGAFFEMDIINTDKIILKYFGR